MNEAALDAELSLPAYASLSDQQAADTVMAKTVSVRRPVESGVLMDAAMALGVWEGWSQRHHHRAQTRQHGMPER